MQEALAMATKTNAESNTFVGVATTWFDP